MSVDPSLPDATAPVNAGHVPEPTVSDGVAVAESVKADGLKAVFVRFLTAELDSPAVNTASRALLAAVVTVVLAVIHSQA